MKALRSFETSLTVYQSTRRNLIEDLKLQQHCCENLVSCHLRAQRARNSLTVSTYDYTCTASVVVSKIWVWGIGGNTELLEVKPVTVPLRPPQIQRGPACDRKSAPSP